MEQQLKEFLMSSEGCISAKEALEKAKKRWPLKENYTKKKSSARNN